MASSKHISNNGCDSEFTNVAFYDNLDFQQWRYQHQQHDHQKHSNNKMHVMTWDVTLLFLDKQNETIYVVWDLDLRCKIQTVS